MRASIFEDSGLVMLSSHPCPYLDAFFLDAVAFLIL
jgi:hypothetical protein